MRRTRAFAAMLAMAALTGPSATAAEVRETYDAYGHLIRRVTVDHDRILEESTLTYDDKGRLIQKKTVKNGRVVLENTAYYDSGKVSRTETWQDGRLVDRKSFLYVRGRLSARIEDSDAAPPRTTTFTYDASGNLVMSETKDADGDVVDRTVAEFYRPVVPIKLGIDIGGAYQSDSGVSELAIGFNMTRKPAIERYGSDPLEVRVSGAYRFSRNRETVVNQYLTARFGIDYNFLLPATTPFLFANVERNEAANLHLDLELVPLGVKFDLIERVPFVIDFSFAPVWNYRSIRSPVEEGGYCNGVLATHDLDCDSSSSKLRGSFRFRAGYGSGGYYLGNTIEFLPNLAPESGLFSAIPTDSILRDTTVLEIKLTDRLAFRYELKLTRDPSLAAQADCTVEDPPALCAGRALSTTGSLTFRFDVRR